MGQTAGTVYHTALLLRRHGGLQQNGLRKPRPQLQVWGNGVVDWAGKSAGGRGNHTPHGPAHTWWGKGKPGSSGNVATWER